MNNSPVILMIRCIGCCVHPDGSPGSCATEADKCGTCPTDPATLPIDNYILVLLLFAIVYVLWFFNKEIVKNALNNFLIKVLPFKRK
ncbi:hypothetical protein [uncultured Polaribacter sp.]|uniref:hypothetical protein n=1 Tax=uncultured Polaribacter sp. TaxID=174711 RepID=UPI00261D1155|nr:hypothetical protein [uncultured Polaribacter sp.]